MRQKIEAVLIFDCGNLPRAERLAGLVNRSRVPAIYPFPRYAEAGGLMAYGPDTIANYKHAAIFVDKIKTAGALGLTIPPSLLLRADQVIE